MLERQALVETLQSNKGALQKEISRLLISVDEWRRRAEARQFMDESASIPELLDAEDSESLLKGESDKVCSKHSSEAEKTVGVKGRQETSTSKVFQLQRSEEVLAPAKKTEKKRNDRELSDNDRNIDSNVISQDESLPSTDTDEVDAVLPSRSKPVAAQTQVTKQQGNVFPYPPGFKQIQERVGRFTGKCGEEDFEVWLADFREATADCKWTDKQRAQWFSWFLSGAAKSTWQRTLRKEEKKSWTDIVRIYKGHYGVHMEPRTAYLRCHELRYEDFVSVQGLLESMKDYQRKAPDQLTDDNLLSILWNKAPYRLQKEVGDIKDWSLQELFERLLRAESRIAERDRRCKTESTRKSPRTTVANEDPVMVNDTSRRRSSTRRQNLSTSAEMQLKNFKCFKCHKKGHLAKDCPETGNTTRAIVTEKEAVSDEECWIRVGVLTAESGLAQAAISNTGPTYKVDVNVEGLKSRALVDNGSQISLVRTEMLPKLKELNGWSMEDCKRKTSKIVSQPLGAGGSELGAKKVVVISVTLDATGKSLHIPCYVVDSARPLWQGAVKNCGIVLGTNAMIGFGMQLVHNNGTTVQPSFRNSELKEPTTENVTRVVLSGVTRLGPRETKFLKATVSQSSEFNKNPQVDSRGVVSPNEAILADVSCDFVEQLWNGESNVIIELNNWGTAPQILAKGQEIGFIEPVMLLESDDPIWDDKEEEVVVRVCQDKEPQVRNEELKKRLQIATNCSEEDRKQLEGLLLEHNSVFALDDKELGETDLVAHSIDTGSAKPVQTLARRLPYALRKELEVELTTLIDTGCIEPCVSPYSSALVLVRKKGGGLRVCVDYRGVNKDTTPDKYPIPRIDDLIDMVGRSKPRVFTSLDLMRGYHQVKMAEESKHKTAFVCHLGQYRRMPFGLTNAPATFQRLMSQLFSGGEWDFVSVYLDDVLIASQNMQEHVEHLKKVLQKLNEAGLRLKPSKCVFAADEIEYLGHTLTANGVKLNSGKVEAVKNFPRPTNVKEVKSFLGLANFYRRHIADMAVISRPLTALTRKEVKFDWTEGCEEAFGKVKQRLVSAPVLHPPDLTKPFQLWTDASERGFGAVLEQKDQEGNCHPIAYASRATNNAERKYAPTELEVAALVFALEHFQVYLLGNRVTVYTDHQALVSSFIPYLKSQTKGLLARWYLRLSPYLPNITLEHKPGRVNRAADALSRAPLPGASRGLTPTTEMLQIEVTEVEPLMARIGRLQREDQDLVQLISYLEKKKLPEEPGEVKKVVTQAQKGFYLLDGILYLENNDVSGIRRIVVPQNLKQEVLSENHEAVFAGHFSPKRMFNKLSQYYYWQGMRGDIQKVCETCIVCASTQGQERRKKPLLHCIPVGEPFECVGMILKRWT